MCKVVKNYGRPMERCLLLAALRKTLACDVRNPKARLEVEQCYLRCAMRKTNQKFIYYMRESITNARANSLLAAAAGEIQRAALGY